MPKSNYGFTLVETVVIVTIIGIVGIILADTITQIYRNQTKVTVVSQARQNAQLALDQMRNIAKGSDRIACGGSGVVTDRIVFVNKGTYTRIMFYPAVGSSQNSSIGVDYPDPLSSTDPCQQPPVNLSTLTNTDPVKGVSVKNGSFTKLPSVAASKDLVMVTFSIDVGLGSGKTTESLLGNGGIQYQTTLGLK